MTFSEDLFLSLTQIFRSVAKVENSRCHVCRGSIKGFVDWTLLLLFFPAHKWLKEFHRQRARPPTGLQTFFIVAPMK